MFKLTNPIVLAVVLLALLAIGIIVGVKWEKWFPKKDKIVPGTGARDNSTTTPPVKRVVAPPDIPIRIITAPATIMLPYSAACSGYTAQYPYPYQGCSYVFGGYVSYAGKRWCLLKRTRCL